MSSEEARLRKVAYNREYRRLNRESISERGKRRYATSKGKKSAYQRLRLYGLSQDQYDALLEEQDFRCAVCLTATPGGSGSWHVDHCHVSKVVRGLLCMRCNTMLGMSLDNTETLSNAVAYLERNKKKNNDHFQHSDAAVQPAVERAAAIPHAGILPGERQPL